MNSNITIVILNWKRPNNIKYKILPEILKCSEVDQIIISHGRKDTYFEALNNSKEIINRKDYLKNHIFGLSLRYLAALESRNRHVLFVDDDIVPLGNTICNLKKVYLKNYPCICGKYGRNIKSNLEYNWKSLDGRYLRCPIVLTSLLLVPIEIVRLFWKSIDPIAPFIYKESKPLWNGEDIVLCLLSLKYLNKNGYIINSEQETPVIYLNTEQDKKVAISHQTGHHIYRSNLIKKFFSLYF